MSNIFCCCFASKNRNRIGGLNRNIVLLMLGLDNSGKTCTAKALVGDTGNLDSTVPTVGFARVETKYKGFQVTVFDLGGAKAFRSVWSQYYHEVHGFIFVVDSSDKRRMEEVKDALQQILKNDKVRGKPILLLCNKSDLDEAHDEIQIVDALNVEQMVNDAQCPTRVEQSVANKNHGLRVGYKWLVKSVIANLADLGPRVEADVLREKALEKKRREDIRRGIEERRRKQEEEEEEGDDDLVEGGGSLAPGFVPMSTLRSKWVAEEVAKEPPTIHEHPDEDTATHNSGSAELIEPTQKQSSPIKSSPTKALAQTITDTSLDKNNKMRSVLTNGSLSSNNIINNNNSKVIENNFLKSPPKTSPTKKQQKSSTEEEEPEEEEEASENIVDNVEEDANSSPLKGLPPISSRSPNVTTKIERLELEPIHQPRKKRNLLKKLNRTTPIRAVNLNSSSSLASATAAGGEKPNSSKSSGSSSCESVRDSQVIRVYT